MIKHWYEGKFEADAWAGWFFPMTQVAESQLFTMTLFFLVSGHTASLTTTWGARRQRWMGLYLLMTLGAIEAIWTMSMRVDWFFSCLLLTEMACALTLELPKKLYPNPTWGSMVAGINIVAFIFAAAWTWGVNFSSTTYWLFIIEKTGWNTTTGLDATWGNILMGNVDLQFGYWNGNMVFMWGAAFVFGYHFLPMLSKVLWSQPWLLRTLVRPEVRLMAFLACCFVVSRPSSYLSEFEPTAGQWTSSLLPAAVAFVESLIFVGCVAIAVGNNWLFQQLGRFSMGALLTHTMWGTRYFLFSDVRHTWPFHDTLQLSALNEQPVLVGLFLFGLPMLYVLSVGRWVQAAVDYLLLFPVMALALWPCFVVLYHTVL
eukprot:Skav226219  [mRNA]  locus=scaffold1288:63584:74632:+ [translate_table: standard]